MWWTAGSTTARSLKGSSPLRWLPLALLALYAALDCVLQYALAATDAASLLHIPTGLLNFIRVGAATCQLGGGEVKLFQSLPPLASPLPGPLPPPLLGHVPLTTHCPLHYVLPLAPPPLPPHELLHIAPAPYSAEPLSSFHGVSSTAPISPPPSLHSAECPERAPEAKSPLSSMPWADVCSTQSLFMSVSMSASRLHSTPCWSVQPK